MPEFKVYQDAKKAARGLPSYSFTLDGAESLYWCPTEHAANRVIGRLRLGRSGEAFGGAGVATAGATTAAALTRGHKRPGRGKVVKAGEVTVETVTTKSGRVKPREKRPGFLFELDGKADESLVVASEAEAKAMCAVAAFKTRGKLGRFAEAEAAFRDKTGKACKVHLVGRKVVAKDEDGGLWAVGLQDGEAPRFKLVVPAPPK